MIATILSTILVALALAGVATLVLATLFPPDDGPDDGPADAPAIAPALLALALALAFVAGWSVASLGPWRPRSMFDLLPHAALLAGALPLGWWFLRARLARIAALALTIAIALGVPFLLGPRVTGSTMPMGEALAWVASGWLVAMVAAHALDRAASRQALLALGAMVGTSAGAAGLMVATHSVKQGQAGAALAAAAGAALLALAWTARRGLVGLPTLATWLALQATLLALSVRLADTPIWAAVASMLGPVAAWIALPWLARWRRPLLAGALAAILAAAPSIAGAAAFSIRHASDATSDPHPGY